jgi:hypothetical protein
MARQRIALEHQVALELGDGGKNGEHQLPGLAQLASSQPRTGR